jgi:hypothetical protein
MRNLAELNIIDGGEPVQRPPPGVEALRRFREEFGEPLPAELLALLRFANGGHPELCVIDGPYGTYAVDHFLHLTAGDEGYGSIWWVMRTWRPFLGERALPFANDGGGNPFFLDIAVHPHPVKDLFSQRKSFRRGCFSLP